MNTKSRPTCPICSALRTRKYAPFCSARCADRDLANWLNGQYAIPATVDDDDSFEEPADYDEIETSGQSGSDSIH